MTVFVTGATGVLGRPAVQLLLQAGYRVRALSRSPENVETISALGAEPVQTGLFDVDALAAAMSGCDAVLHLATRIPPVSDLRKPGVWDENDRIRTAGTKAIVDAAERLTEVRCVLYPGVSFMYADNGAKWVDATTAVLDVPAPLKSTLEAEAAVERFGESAANRRGVVLRFGGFYGPSSAESQQMLAMARRGICIRVANRTAYKSMIWIDDAAGAVLTALQSAISGVFDVVEDEPGTQSELIAAIAKAAGRDRLWALPPWALRFVLQTEMRQLAGRSLRISNRRFREATGWRPSVSNQTEGWCRMSAKN